MGIGKRIREERERQGLTQKQLAARVGVTAAAIANYENEISYPREGILYSLLKVLNVDANYLFQDHHGSSHGHHVLISGDELKQLKKYRALDAEGREIVNFILDREYARLPRKRAVAEAFEPHISLPFFQDKVSAGLGNFISNGTTEQLSIRLLPETRGADYVVQVTGNSMEPTYFDGDLVLVHSQSRIDLGEIGLWILNGDGYIKECGNQMLLSRNPNYAPIPIQAEDHLDCFGKVLRRLEKDWILESDPM